MIDLTNAPDPIEDLLARVELPPRVAVAGDLPLEVRQAAEEVARRTWHLRRAEGASLEEAKSAASEAYARTASGLVAGRSRTDAAGIAAHAPASDASYQGAPTVAGGEHDAIGAARSQADRDAAKLAGFAPADPVYRQGTRVIDLGVENARASRVEHDAKPLVRDYCESFIRRIDAEERRMTAVPAASIAMLADGRLFDLHHASSSALPISVEAFGSLTSRLGYGGAAYLGGACPPELRALNVNAQRASIQDLEHSALLAEQLRAAREGDASEEADPKQIVLRIRKSTPGAPESIFAAVSPGYAPFDADKIAAALKRAAPADARGTVTYDGTRSRFEVMFHSDVQPKHFVAGEFFKAGVIIRTSDTGGGGVRVSAAVWQNLCLNLIIVDRCAKEIANLRHVGNVYELAKRFEKAFRDALESISHFTRAWGYACEEDVLARTRLVADDMPTDPREALPGIFNGILDSGLVSIGGRGKLRRIATVEKLVACWERDESAAKLAHAGVTRAAIANAFTRFAHEELEGQDPWAEDELQRDAGALLWGRNDKAPKPLPYLSLEDIAEASPAAALTH